MPSRLRIILLAVNTTADFNKPAAVNPILTWSLQKKSHTPQPGSDNFAFPVLTLTLRSQDQCTWWWGVFGCVRPFSKIWLLSEAGSMPCVWLSLL